MADKDDGLYCVPGYIPMCLNRSRPGYCCLYDESTGRWFTKDNAPCNKKDS
ncbi:hypothetical protein [Gordonia paraffinivorans]|uniref:hypothetical protein n=1 Tax=Gordonia paraffinivorans TaxID=175628 RepID=UPI003FCC2983